MWHWKFLFVELDVLHSRSIDGYATSGVGLLFYSCVCKKFQAIAIIGYIIIMDGTFYNTPGWTVCAIILPLYIPSSYDSASSRVRSCSYI